MISNRLAARITAWAEDYQGPCQHVAPQVGSVGDLRSGCTACSTAFAGWDEPRPCDICGRMADPRGAWSLPPRQTGGVMLLIRLCSTCSRRELHDPEEDRMNSTTTTCCGACRSTFAAQTAARTDDFSTLHAVCREGLAAAMTGYGRRATTQSLAVRVRVVAAVRALKRTAA